jgi:8-oxo-dGTP diphosphatase
MPIIMDVFLAVTKDLFEFGYAKISGSPLPKIIPTEKPKPRVGVGVVIRKDNKILLGLRKNAHGADSWSPPGGHLEFMETIEECAMRETTEETGLSITNIQRPVFTEEFYKVENKHYINLMVTVDWKAGDPQVLEQDKCDRWEWFEWNNLPSPLFLPLQNHINQGYNPFTE